MMRSVGPVGRYGKHAVGLALVLTTYAAARLPRPSARELGAMSSRFRFEEYELPTVGPVPAWHVRQVNPRLAGIAAWISSVGAGAAVNDLDGDGLPNDVCYVDVRSNHVIVAPVPGTGVRYDPFVLDPSPLPYDSLTMAPMGCLPGDFNEDGLEDLLVYYWGRTPVLFLARDRGRGQAAALGPGSFVAQELVEPIARWFTNAATLADLDGDGHADIVIGNYFPDGARVLDAATTDQAWMQHSMSRAQNGGRKHILRWVAATAGDQPSARFVDVPDALDASICCGWTLAVAAADLDGDLLPELYFANDFGPDRLLHNRSTPGHIRFALVRGQPSLSAPASKVLGRDSYKGMGVDFGDLRGDGHLDICVSNIADEYALEESHFLFMPNGDMGALRDGVAPFADRSEALGLSRGGWGWDCKLDDFDNSGVLDVVRATGFVNGTVNRWPELHELAMGNDELISNPARWPRFAPGTDLSGGSHLTFAVPAPDGRYYDISDRIGLGRQQVSRGIATADVDGDGLLDFVVANQWEPARYYHNMSARPGAFLGLRLRLTTFSDAGADQAHARAAVTAQARIRIANGPQTLAQIDGGNGHSGKRSNDIHFGLGPVSAADSVQVGLRWRDADGSVHDRTIFLHPGWHVVMLGAHSGEIQAL